MLEVLDAHGQVVKLAVSGSGTDADPYILNIGNTLSQTDKEVPFAWFLVKQAFTDVLTTDIVVSYAIINTSTGEATTHTKRWRGWLDVTVPNPLTDYLVHTGGNPLTLEQLQVANLATAEKQDALLTYFAPQLEAHTTAAANQLQAKSSAGVLFSVSGYNGSTADQYIQVHDTASTPANGALPMKSFLVKANSQFSFDFAGSHGVAVTAGIYVCSSSSRDTKTIGVATDCRFEVGYK